MKRSSTLLILMPLVVSMLAGGCSWYRKPVVVPPGTVVELAKPATFYGVVTDEATGKRSVRLVQAWPGWLVGPGEPPGR